MLERINKPNDIKLIKPAEYTELAAEIRKFLIEKVSKTGGHLASNLGVVELTMALHIAFNLPKDKIIWDVGHQSYTHKILTGRKGGFDTLRKFGGMSGFPKRDESDYDAFDTGHSSTSISAGIGLAVARDLARKRFKVISVIGDGALTGGMAYEALNNANAVRGNFIIVFNDNGMSIAPNVGGISRALDNFRLSMAFNDFRVSDAYKEFKENTARNLARLPHGKQITRRLKLTKDNLRQRLLISGQIADQGPLLPGQIVEYMGINYFGPVDGHDIGKLLQVFNAAAQVKGPVLVHVITQKGKGYSHAEQRPDSYHGVSPFDINTGQAKAEKSGKSYAGIFSDKICAIAAENEKIVGITAAMPDGTGLTEFSKKFPKRFFDVGIAEEHAVTFAAGLSAGGMTPVFGVYSSFLQRGYDQMLHDVCIQNLKVIFAIDHAGLVGSDGETHQGIFDISYLATIPGMTVFAPKNARELEAALDFAVNEFDRPIAIRYPSGKASECLTQYMEPIKAGKSEMIFEEKDIALVAAGRMVEIAVEVRETLKKKGYNVTLVNARFVVPIDRGLFKKLQSKHSLVVTLEENVLSGGYGEHVCRYVMDHRIGIRVLPIALPNDYIEHGSVKILYKEAGIDAQTIIQRVESAYLETKDN